MATKATKKRKGIRTAGFTIGNVHEWMHQKDYRPISYSGLKSLRDLASSGACAYRNSAGEPMLNIGCQHHPLPKWKRRAHTLYDRVLGHQYGISGRVPLKPLKSYLKYVETEYYVDQLGLHVRLSRAARTAVARDFRKGNAKRVALKKKERTKALATIQALVKKLETMYPPLTPAATTAEATTTTATS